MEYEIKLAELLQIITTKTAIELKHGDKFTWFPSPVALQSCLEQTNPEILNEIVMSVNILSEHTVLVRI